ncbi:Vacuolar protein sorting-associated protein 51 [Intoshia linei]|uniref:Vacuolar protein sorting-associated protein 51 homolog n=1 Tax=Intoshia linei TaxID=1819745 RepID=A0A177B5J5_9BILA|nr:Vacuolar protein sorting-associated protein 51 [Intoshia linei]
MNTSTVSDETPSETRSDNNKFDMDHTEFNAKTYIDGLIRRNNISSLLQYEKDIIKQTKVLDGEMQTLVYENYKKFISASDNIKKMNTDFQEMHKNLKTLKEKFNESTTFSAQIGSRLDKHRQEVNEKANSYSMLKKLQFLLELPSKLKNFIDSKLFYQAVTYYNKAQIILSQYSEIVALNGIKKECLDFYNELRKLLIARYNEKDLSHSKYSESVSLLIKLGENTNKLCDQYLDKNEICLNEQLDAIRQQYLYFVEYQENSDLQLSPPMDILEYVDYVLNGFFNKFTHTTCDYSDIFLKGDQINVKNAAQQRLDVFVNNYITKLFDLIRQRTKLEKKDCNNVLLIRALDRFYKKLTSIKPEIELFNQISTRAEELVLMAASDRVEMYEINSFENFKNIIFDMRKKIASDINDENVYLLSECLHTAQLEFTKDLKITIEKMKTFLDGEITFSFKKNFRNTYMVDHVRINYFYKLFMHCLEYCVELSNAFYDKSISVLIVLILSRLCYNFSNNVINRIHKLFADAFPLNEQDLASVITEDNNRFNKLKNEYTSESERLLQAFTENQANIAIQMIKRSIETRDWLHCSEPRSLRSPIKRLVVIMLETESNIGQFYKDSNSSKRSIEQASTSSHGMQSTDFTMDVRKSSMFDGNYWTNSYKNQSNSLNSTMDNQFESKINRLFGEKVRYDDELNFSKHVVLLLIAKRILKGFVESVRLRIFGTFGFQQIQVDIFYLQQSFWRILGEDQSIKMLFDECLSSVYNRCTKPVFMDQTIVEMICDEEKDFCNYTSLNVEKYINIANEKEGTIEDSSIENLKEYSIWDKQNCVAKDIFMNDLYRFMYEWGNPLQRIPKIGQRSLDLYQLFISVISRGGLFSVIKNKLWKVISKELDLPKSLTSAAYTLKQKYIYYLFGYEVFHDSGIILSREYINELLFGKKKLRNIKSEIWKPYN